MGTQENKYCVSVSNKFTKTGKRHRWWYCLYLWAKAVFIVFVADTIDKVKFKYWSLCVNNHEKYNYNKLLKKHWNKLKNRDEITSKVKGVWRHGQFRVKNLNPCQKEEEIINEDFIHRPLQRGDRMGTSSD